MSIYELIPKLVRASFENDKKMIEAVSLMIMKKLNKEHPEVSLELSKILSYANNGLSSLRSVNIDPIPVDKETRYSLAQVIEPLEMEPPILDTFTYDQINNFIKERGLLDRFLKEQIVPPMSVLLYGLPGVGKTYIAKWLSYKLNLPMISMDLATSISSYLGRSGQNLKTLFSYAKSFPSILFLDELDAIAKKRDDMSDLGELKRIVNVLLKELEDLPSSCVVIGATNHPELLDKAIWRRFDRSIQIKLPEQEQISQLLERHLKSHMPFIDKRICNILTQHIVGVNASDICKLCEHIKRAKIIGEENLNGIIVKEMLRLKPLNDKSNKIEMCKMIKKYESSLTYRDIEMLTGISAASVSRYLKKKEIRNDR